MNCATETAMAAPLPPHRAELPVTLIYGHHPRKPAQQLPDFQQELTRSPSLMPTDVLQLPLSPLHSPPHSLPASPQQMCFATEAARAAPLQLHQAELRA